MALHGPTLGTAKIAILTVTDEEFVAVRSVFGTSVNIDGTQYFVTRVSETGSYDIVARRNANQANMASRDAVGKFVEDFRPEVFLLIGTAGGVYGRGDPVHVLLGDVVIADYVDYCEHWKLVPKKHAPRRCPLDQPSVYLRERFPEPLRWLPEHWTPLISVPRPPKEKAELVPMDKGIPTKVVCTSRAEPKAFVGNIVSGDKIFGDPTAEDQRRIFKYYDKALAVEMEGAGVGRGLMEARISLSYNPQYLVIRGISDLVNCKGNDETRHQWTEYAAATAATFASQFVKKIISASTYGG